VDGVSLTVIASGGRVLRVAGAVHTGPYDAAHAPDRRAREHSETDILMRYVTQALEARRTDLRIDRRPWTPSKTTWALARYNTWMNRRTFACAPAYPTRSERDVGAFFQSLHER